MNTSNEPFQNDIMKQNGTSYLGDSNNYIGFLFCIVILISPRTFMEREAVKTKAEHHSQL